MATKTKKPATKAKAVAKKAPVRKSRAVAKNNTASSYIENEFAVLSVIAVGGLLGMIVLLVTM